MSNTDVQKLLRKCRREGWSQEMMQNGHYRITHPSGEWVTMSATPSCKYWRKKVEKQIRNINRKYPQPEKVKPMIEMQEIAEKLQEKAVEVKKNKGWSDDDDLLLAAEVEKLVQVITEGEMVSLIKKFGRTPAALWARTNKLRDDGILGKDKARLIPWYSTDDSNRLARFAGIQDGSGKKYTPPPKPVEKVAVLNTNSFKTLVDAFNRGLVDLSKSGGTIELEIFHESGIPQVKVRRRVEEEY